MQILAFVSKVHQVVLPEDAVDYETVTLEKVFSFHYLPLQSITGIVFAVICWILSYSCKFQIESNIVRCPDPEYAEKMIAAIDKVRVRGDSIGGVVTCIARNVPRVSVEALWLFYFALVLIASYPLRLIIHFKFYFESDNWFVWGNNNL